MKLLVILFLLFMVLVDFGPNYQPSPSLIVKVEAANLVEETCKRLPHYDLCISTLKSDPRSSSADVKGLTHIIVEANIAYTNQTLLQINKMLNATRSQALKICLHVCSEVYEDALYGSLPNALAVLAINDYPAAKMYVKTGSITTSETCELAFKEPPVQKPVLKGSDNHLFALGEIAIAMIDSLI